MNYGWMALTRRAAISGLFFAALSSGHAAAQAERFADPATGLAITAFAPFKVSPGSQPDQDIVIRIDSTTAKPVGLNEYGGLCSLAFKHEELAVPTSQAEINDFLTGPQSLRLMRRIAELTFTGNIVRPVKVPGGVHLVEHIGRPKAGPDFRNKHMYAAVMRTPKGTTQFICVTSRAHFPAALPLFRRMRASIQPG